MNAISTGLTQLSPISVEGLESALSGIRHVLIMEEACGGICSILAANLGSHCDVTCVDLGKEFVTHGSISQLHRLYGLDGESIAQKVRKVLENEN